MTEYEGKVRLVIKNYPYKYRDYSHIAAEASLAAGDQGKYWEMHDMLLARSPRLDRNSLIQYGEELGLDMNRYVSDLDSMKHKELIEQDKELAFSLDLYNTPTYFINGRKVIGNRPYVYLKKIIDEELRRAEH
jgi:protein-disulfide isomerase